MTMGILDVRVVSAEITLPFQNTASQLQASKTICFLGPSVSKSTASVTLIGVSEPCMLVLTSTNKNRLSCAGISTSVNDVSVSPSKLILKPDAPPDCKEMEAIRMVLLPVLRTFSQAVVEPTVENL